MLLEVSACRRAGSKAVMTCGVSACISSVKRVAVCGIGAIAAHGSVSRVALGVGRLVLTGSECRRQASSAFMTWGVSACISSVNGVGMQMLAANSLVCTEQRRTLRSCTHCLSTRQFARPCLPAPLHTNAPCFQCRFCVGSVMKCKSSHTHTVLTSAPLLIHQSLYEALPLPKPLPLQKQRSPLQRTAPALTPAAAGEAAPCPGLRQPSGMPQRRPGPARGQCM